MNLSELFPQMFKAFETKDLAAVMSYFAEDATLIDPHYPQVTMRGKAAIEQGLGWAFTNLEKPGFTVRHLWAEDTSGVIEVDTHHVFRGGMKLNFPQIFVVETQDGLITRLQSYPPYGPPGIGGLLTRLTRLVWRLQGKFK